jgi:hypothetical protein
VTSITTRRPLPMRARTLAILVIIASMSVTMPIFSAVAMPSMNACWAASNWPAATFASPSPSSAPMVPRM